MPTLDCPIVKMKELKYKLHDRVWVVHQDYFKPSCSYVGPARISFTNAYNSRYPYLVIIPNIGLGFQVFAIEECEVEYVIGG